MKCPVCSVELRMTDRQGVEIDYCPQCRGVWLDRGELDKIIERAGDGDARDDRSSGHGRPPEHENRERYEHRDKHGHEGKYGHGHYKKKSIWREMFDFD